MQNNPGKNIILILKYALFMLLCAQIVTGCVWCILNFVQLSPFPEMMGMMRMSSNLYLKNDTGIIYPSLLLLVRTLTLNGPLPFFLVMYVFQLLLAFVAWYVFGTIVLGIKKKTAGIFFTLSVITFPMAMQCHLALLEHSFVSGFLCLLVSFSVGFAREWKDPSKGRGVNKALLDVSVVCLFWLLLALTDRKFIFIGMIPVLFFVVPVVRKTESVRKIAKAFPAGIALVFLAIILLSDSLFATSEHRITDDIRRSLYYRVAWSEDLDERDHWPDHVLSVVGEEVMYDVMSDPGLVRSEFTEAVEGRLGREETSRVFPKWAYDAFKDNKKGIIRETLSEILGYVFPAVKTETVLSGSGDPGFVTGNYDVMLRYTPVLSKYYLRGFSILSVIGVIFSLICAVLAGKEELAKKKTFLKQFVPTLIMTLLAAVCYTFEGNNIWDYKKAVFSACMWICVIAGTVLAAGDKKET